ncbi:42660_t:CDS:2 [Gigaspora margarita]|uniref:42660_t:CDS:1 n=1 Tax=Gigaspora margarita TaxID=4874 RepID=A0ABN7US06_GIGMA|nr:42660_t:CDS:2 [Gigaspora margarita]
MVLDISSKYIKSYLSNDNIVVPGISIIAIKFISSRTAFVGDCQIVVVVYQVVVQWPRVSDANA